MVFLYSRKIFINPEEFFSSQLCVAIDCVALLGNIAKEENDWRNKLAENVVYDLIMTICRKQYERGDYLIISLKFKSVVKM